VLREEEKAVKRSVGGGVLETGATDVL